MGGGEQIAIGAQVGSGKQFFKDMFTTKGYWNPKYRAKLMGKIDAKAVGAKAEAEAELGLGAASGSQRGSIMNYLGNGASGEVQGGRITAQLVENSDSVISQTFQKQQVILIQPKYSGAYDLNRQVTSSIRKPVSDELTSNASFKPGQIFQSFLIDQLEAMNFVAPLT